MVLMDLFHRLRRDKGVELAVAHFDHGLRAEAHHESAVVADYCQDHRIDFHVERFDPESRSAGESIEMWGRRLRYQRLAELSQWLKAQYIATGHHLNDMAETILLALARGTGIDGLTGIPQKREYIIRPLLKFTRREIQNYARSRELQWVEDESNQDQAIQRNFVRHSIIDPWNQSDAHLLDGLAQTAENLHQIQEAVDYFLDQLIAELKIDDHQEEYRLARRRLLSLPPIMPILLIKRLCGAGDHPWRSHRYSSLATFLQQSRTGQFAELPDDWLLLRDREEFILRIVALAEDFPELQVWEGTFHRGQLRFHLRLVDEIKQFTHTGWTEYIDAAKIAGKRLVLRSWKPGDQFYPLGMANRKKLSDFLIDEKVDRFRKQRQLVLTADEEIIWVCGRRLADIVKVTASTTSYAELSIDLNVGKA